MSAADTTEITEEQIRQRAYEISQGPEAGSEEENWIRAEQELRTEGDAPSPASGARRTGAETS